MLKTCLNLHSVTRPTHGLQHIIIIIITTANKADVM